MFGIVKYGLLVIGIDNVVLGMFTHLKHPVF